MKLRENPRIVCRLARFREAVLGRGAGSHLAGCPDCQAYFRAEARMVESLRGAVPQRGPAEATEDLAERIVRAVREAAPAPRPSRRPSVLVASAAAAAVFVVAFALVRFQPVPSAQRGVVADVDVSQLLYGVDALRLQLMKNVGPSAKRIAADNPLAKEMASVEKDARSAVNFLAMNFIPMDSPGAQMPGNGPGGY